MCSVPLSVWHRPFLGPMRNVEQAKHSTCSASWNLLLLSVSHTPLSCIYCLVTEMPRYPQNAAMLYDPLHSGKIQTETGVHIPSGSLANNIALISLVSSSSLFLFVKCKRHNIALKACRSWEKLHGIKFQFCRCTAVWCSARYALLSLWLSRVIFLVSETLKHSNSQYLYTLTRKKILWWLTETIKVRHLEEFLVYKK